MGGDGNVLTALFEIKGKQASKDREMSAATAPPEGDEFASYSTGESEDDGAPQTPTNSARDAWVDTVDDIKRLIGAADATQNAIVDKLAMLEKLVTCVQEDVSWVRGDVRVVHEALDNMVDHVSTLKSTVTAVDGLPNDRPPEVSAWGTWKENAHTHDHEFADTTGVAEDELVQLPDEGPSNVNEAQGLQSAIEETQLFDMNTALHENRTSPGEEAGGEGWLDNAETGSGHRSPRGWQTGGAYEEDSQEPEYHQMEMTLECTQTGTQAPGRSMWSDYTTTVTNMRAPVFVGGNNSNGCSRSKRARGSSLAIDPGNTSETREEEIAQHGGLNLNLSPAWLGAREGMSGRGRNDAATGRGPGSRGGGRGGGRGAGRVKRPPQVQPRYTSTASALNMSIVKF